MVAVAVVGDGCIGGSGAPGTYILSWWYAIVLKI